MITCSKLLDDTPVDFKYVAYVAETVCLAVFVQVLNGGHSGSETLINVRGSAGAHRILV